MKFFPAYSQIFAHYFNDDKIKEYCTKRLGVDCRVFNPLTSLTKFPYSYALYSAGHADLDVAGSADSTMLDRRDDTIVISDSGGFQVAKGVKGWKPDEYYGRRQEILRWQEDISDIAIAMDVPAFAVKKSGQTQISCFADALAWSVANFTYQVENRNPNKCRMLNVISGNVAAESFAWYEAVKKFSRVDVVGDGAFAGWSFGGCIVRDHALQIDMLKRLIRDGMLSGRHNWLHFLGIADVDSLKRLRQLETALRVVLEDETFTISSDASNPFRTSGFGNFYGENVGFEDSIIKVREMPKREWLEGGVEELSSVFTLDAQDRIKTAGVWDKPWEMTQIATMLHGSSFNLLPIDVRDLLRGGSEKGYVGNYGYFVLMAISLEMFLRNLNAGLAKVTGDGGYVTLLTT